MRGEINELCEIEIFFVCARERERKRERKKERQEYVSKMHVQQSLPLGKGSPANRMRELPFFFLREFFSLSDMRALFRVREPPSWDEFVHSIQLSQNAKYLSQLADNRDVYI